MNILHWHLTDDVGWRIEIKKYPRLTTIGSRRRESETGTWNSGKSDGTPHEGFYTQEQIRDIVQYAARRNITIVPEIEMPGHASAAATAYPFLSLKSPREVPTTFIVNTAFDPTSEKTYAFLSDVLDEVVALFPSRIIHIGGDEVRYAQQWKDVPEIEAFMKKNNMKSYADVQMYFTNRMSGIVAKKGRRMMGWNEIYGHDVNGDGGGKAGTKLDTNAVIHFWKGNTDLAKTPSRTGMRSSIPSTAPLTLITATAEFPCKRHTASSPFSRAWRNSTIPGSRGWGRRYGRNGLPIRSASTTRHSPGPAPLRKWAGHLPGKRISRILKSA